MDKDSRLREAVEEELAFEPSIDAANIGVAAEDNVVTLTGHVPTYAQKLAAEHAAWRVKHAVRHLEGVTGVTNNITLKATPREREVKLRIEQALRRNAETEARSILVDLSDGHTVMLDGRVNTYSERMAAERAAWSVPGVTAVVDRITIGA